MEGVLVTLCHRFWVLSLNGPLDFSSTSCRISVFSEEFHLFYLVLKWGNGDGSSLSGILYIVGIIEKNVTRTALHMMVIVWVTSHWRILFFFFKVNSL